MGKFKVLKRTYIGGKLVEKGDVVELQSTKNPNLEKIEEPKKETSKKKK